MIVGCSSEPIGFEDEDEVSILNRNGSSSCNNFITNGDFSSHTYSNLGDCSEAFNNGLVPSWTVSAGTPDLMYQECEAVFGPCFTTTDFAVLARSTSTGWTEGISQAITPPYDTDVEYHLCFDAGSDSNTTLRVFTQASQSGQSTVVFNEAISRPCNSPPHNFEVTIVPTESIKGITFSSAGSTGVVNLDNVVLTCSSTNFEDILFEAVDPPGGSSQSPCTFEFEPYIDGPLTVTSYLWDFGDGNTSTLANPTHSYLSMGDYTVTLKIIDDRLCCTTREIEVTCETPECPNFICWEDFIGNFSCASGVTFILPDNSTQYVSFVKIPSGTSTCKWPVTYPIPQLVHVNTHYCEIYEQIKFAAASLGYTLYNSTYDRTGQEVCTKGTWPALIPDSGYFIRSDLRVQFVHGVGIDAQGNCDPNSQGNSKEFWYPSTNCDPNE